ncbi:MAG: LytTR family DNA-binding domain-containing protein [Spirosomataceae bacterium]
MILLFLDINMPSMSGIDFYKALLQEVMVIFTTAYSEYAVEGFNLNALSTIYSSLLLSIGLYRLLKRPKEYYYFLHPSEAATPQYLFIKADYSIYKIALSTILFIEGLDDYLKVHLEGSKLIVARMTMKVMIDKLPAEDFIRVHRSFIVPFKRIEAVRNKMIILQEEEIPDRYKL